MSKLCLLKSIHEFLLNCLHNYSPAIFLFSSAVFIGSHYLKRWGRNSASVAFLNISTVYRAPCQLLAEVILIPQSLRKSTLCACSKICQHTPLNVLYLDTYSWRLSIYISSSSVAEYFTDPPLSRTL